MNLAVIFGGRSYEYDVSILTAIELMANIDTKQHNLFALLLKDKCFYMPNNYMNIDTYKDASQLNRCKTATFSNGYLYSTKKNVAKKLAKIDCAILACHGGEGENGELCGYLSVNNIPYTVSNCEGLALTMDKDVTKAICHQLDLPAIPYLTLFKEKYSPEALSSVALPAIIKPCRLGSSIGISIANNLKELKINIEIAFQFDNKVIVEKLINNKKEYNCATMLYNGELIHSEIEQPYSQGNYYTFEEKYVKTQKNCVCQKEQIASDIQDTIYQYNELIYQRLELGGVVRMDYLYDEDQKQTYLCEINSIPGSLSYNMFTNKGIQYPKLIDMLVKEGIKKHAATQAPLRYKSDTLFYAKPKR